MTFGEAIIEGLSIYVPAWWTLFSIYLLLNHEYVRRKSLLDTDHVNREARLELQYGEITPRMLDHRLETYRAGYWSHVICCYLFLWLSPFQVVSTLFLVYQLLMISFYMEGMPKTVREEHWRRFLDEAMETHEKELRDKEEVYRQKLEAKLERRKAAIVEGNYEVKFVER